MNAKQVRAQLKALKGRSCFGSDTHRFALKKPLSEKQIATFEAERGFTLPESYRDFLRHVGSSGAGPYYGLLPLEDWELAGQGDDAITIVDQGCSYYALLKVSGPQRGRVVYINADGGPDYYPENADFASWYQRWLDELAWGYDDFWFGTGMPGSERELLLALDGPRAVEALAALSRVATPLPETKRAILARIEDKALGKVAARTAVKFWRDELIPTFKRWLSVAGVQELALEELSNTHDTSWHQDARELLKIPALASAAYRALEDTFSEAELVAMLTTPQHSAALQQLGRVPGTLATPHLLAMLDASDREVRLTALRCLRDRKDQGAHAAVCVAIEHETDTELLETMLQILADDFAVLQRAASHKDGKIRFMAAYHLGELRDPRAATVLEQLSTDRVQPVGTVFTIAEQATRALAKLSIN